MAQAHIGELKLRRLRLGELSGAGADEARVHVDACAECQARMKALGDEQRRFEEAIPFERFTAGVQRARRGERTAPARTWVTAAGLAAALLLVIAVQQQLQPEGGERGSLARIKGGADVVLRIAGAGGGPQRLASPGAPEALGPGERVRIGYQGGPWRYVLAISIDEGGEVTPLYPERGASLPAEGGDELHYLPESLEFTGRGAERVIVVLSDRPIEVDEVTREARRAHREAGGDVLRMPALRLPGEQFHRMLLKP